MFRRAGALRRQRRMGWGGKWEGGSRWGIRVNPWLIHVNVWQKPLQYCKVISLQLIKINGGKKEKAEESEIKLPTSAESSKKPESSRKTSISALLTMPKPSTHKAYCVDHNKLWKILKEMGIADHLTCLLRNLYAGQEAIVRTGHGTTDWFQIGKGVRQGCILSLCLFNLCAEYIMRNTGMEEAQAAIKISRRHINNLRYEDDTTLMA